MRVCRFVVTVAFNCVFEIRGKHLTAQEKNSKNIFKHWFLPKNNAVKELTKLAHIFLNKNFTNAIKHSDYVFRALNF